MDKFSAEFLVPKHTIDFLIPYIEKVEAQQIPVNQPIPQPLTLDSLEKKMQEFEKLILHKNFKDIVSFPVFNSSGIL